MPIPNKTTEKPKRDLPKVSTIIPCFNGEKYISEAIESVLNQTYENIQIVIVNDGSTDNSEKIINQYLCNNRTIYIKHTKNRGIPSARNTGIRASDGELIAFLDQDDIWLPDKIEKQQHYLNEINDTNIGLIFSDLLYGEGENYFQREWPKKIIPENINRIPNNVAFEHLYLNNFIPMISVIITKTCLETVGLLDEKIRGGADDYELFLRISAKYGIRYLDTPLAVKRLHSENFSDIERLNIDQLYITEKITTLYPHLKLLQKKKYASIYNSLGSYYLSIHDCKNAKDYLKKAIYHKPAKATYWYKLLESLIGIHTNEKTRLRFHNLGKKIYRKLYE